MDLSILIVTYNSRQLIGVLLDHVYQQMQDASVSMEVVLVDNHSRDGTADFVASAYPWVKLTASPVNLGFAAGNNMAAKQAQGRYLLLLNPDAVPDAGTLARGVALMDAHPDVALGGGGLRDSQGQPQPSARMFPTLPDELFTMAGLAARFPRSPVLARMDRQWADPEETADVDWIPGAFVFLRASMFAQVGHFDERFFMYYEEVDLCRAFRCQGWLVRYWPELRAMHIGGASARTVSEERISRSGSQLELWRMRSALLYYRKHHGRVPTAALHWLERAWFAMRRFRSNWRGQVERAQDFAQHVLQLRQAWADTDGGRRSPGRPW
jgi:N-acetylglucosaminyl-diphospho-decaprenol L-rhamnosyltransferase